MARSRNIKPGFFSNELLAELSAFDRLLFVGLWCLADRDGRLEDRPKRIKMELFPCDSYDVSDGLESLCKAGFIERYQVEAFSVVEIVNFTKHQSPHGSERDSTLPDRNGYLTVNERRRNVVIPYKSTKVHIKDSLLNVNPPLEVGEPTVRERPDSLIPDSLIPDSLIPDSLIPDSLIPDSLIPDSCKDQELGPDENGKPKPKPRSVDRKAKIPNPFLVTAEMRAWAAESVPGVELKTETEKFVDYWRGEAKTKADWPATWRNWMRKAQQDHNRPGPRGGALINRQQQIEDENARVVREMFARDEAYNQQQRGLADTGLGDVIELDDEVIHVD